MRTKIFVFINYIKEKKASRYCLNKYIHDIDMVISFYNKKRFHNLYVRAKQGGFMRRVGTDCASKVSQIDLR